MQNTSKASIILIVLAVIAAVYTQYSLIDGYESASAKTRSLYGLRHFSYMGYAIIPSVALLLSVFSLFAKEKLKIVGITSLLAIGSLLLLILPIWRSFI